jgi:hypothetical protein
MKTLEQIKEIVLKVHTLQHESTGLYRNFQDSYTKEKSAIELNNDYSEAGKQKLVDSLKERKTVELLQRARTQRNEFIGLWKEAKKEAENLIHSKVKPVDPVKEERFNKKLAEVKTEILLSNHRKGKELLTQFLQTIDEQAFAAKVKEEFPTLIQPILSSAGADTEKYRQELFSVFEQVKKQSLHPEALEAINIAEFADQAMQSSFFNSLVQEKVSEHLGREVGQFVNKPDEFFAKYPNADIKLPASKTVEQIVEEEDARTL